MITVETDAMAQDLVKQATLQEGQWGQTWHMDQCPSSDAKMICNPPQNLDYSGKKRRKEKERKRILRDYILRWKWLKSLELAQLSVLLSKEMGSWELNLISAVDRENYIPAHLDSCTVKMYSHRTYLDCSSFNSKLHVFCVIYAFNCVNYILCKEREISVWGSTHHSTQWAYVPDWMWAELWSIPKVFA